MYTSEELIIEELRSAGINPVLSLPCEKIKNLLSLIEKNFLHIPLTREEEGIGISAGAALAGKRPALFVQSSGMGNMLNALMSLTKTYELPLALFVSWRGVYNEKIPAQIPMGRSLQGILNGCGIEYRIIEKKDDLKHMRHKLSEAYEKNRITAFLMSPEIWDGVLHKEKEQRIKRQKVAGIGVKAVKPVNRLLIRYQRFDFIKTIASMLKDEIVVSNLGIPSKELFFIRHRPLNFYMLGSMGMATPLGLGISLFTERRVIVIDGDGSILMNPASLGTVAFFNPENLIIVAIDNGAYGSTGNQPTLTSRFINLEAIARAFGFKHTVKVYSKALLRRILNKKYPGSLFIHAVTLPGNKEVPDIPFPPSEIKEYFSNAISPDEAPL